MTVQVIRPTPQLVKPDPWPLDPNLVVPEGQWAWEGKPLWFPFWLGGGSPFEIATGLKGTLVGDVAWTVGTRGPGMDFPDQQVSGESIDFPQTERTHPTGQSLVVIGGGTRRAPSSGAGSGGCVVSTDNQNSDGYRLFAFDDGTCRFRLMQSGSGTNVDTSLTWSAGDRIILAGRYDGSEQRVIAHNLTTGERSTNAVSNSGNLTTDTSKDLYVGNHGTGSIGGSTNPWYGVLELLHITTTLYPVAAIDRLITRDPFAPFRPRRFRFIEEAADDGTTTVTLLDSLNFNENLARDFWGDRNLSDQPGFTENQENAKETTKEASDSLGFSENLTRDGIFSRQISDDLSLTENLLVDRILTRLVEDSFGFSENLDRTITKSGAPVVRQIQDTLNFAENLVRDTDLTRLMDDSLTFEENLEVLVNDSPVAQAVERHWRFERWKNLRRERRWSDPGDMWDS